MELKDSLGQFSNRKFLKGKTYKIEITGKEQV